MRDDAVPRMTPRAVLSLQEEALSFTWSDLEECADTWGLIGGMLLGRARCDSIEPFWPDYGWLCMQAFE
jgi:hypothetical protein